MAFIIKNIEGRTASDIHAALSAKLRQSRFEARVDYKLNRVSIHGVRLINTKDYCGNHPFACPIRPTGERPHKHHRFLEGADWVAFNDMVNDVLDAMNVSANVASSLCIIRKGAERRVEYDGHKLANDIDSEWDRDSKFYEDWRGKVAPRSDYPQGTPGIPEWELAKEKTYRAE